MLTRDELKLVFQGHVKVCIILAVVAFVAFVVTMIGAPSPSEVTVWREDINRIRKDAGAIKQLRQAVKTRIPETEIRDDTNFIAFLGKIATSVGFRERLKNIDPDRKDFNANTQIAIFDIALPDVALYQAVDFMYEIQSRRPYVNIRNIRLNSIGSRRMESWSGLWQGNIRLQFFVPRAGAESAEGT